MGELGQRVAGAKRERPARALHADVGLPTGDLVVGGEDLGLGAPGVVHPGLGPVLALDRVAEQAPLDHAADRERGAAEPIHQIEGVDGLVDEQGAALAIPASTPGAGGVVRAAARAAEVHRRVANLTELTVAQQLVQAGGERVVAVLEDGGRDQRFDTARPGVSGGDHAFDIGGRGGERLLADDVFAGGEGRDHLLGMLGVRGAHADQVDPGISERLAPIRGDARGGESGLGLDQVGVAGPGDGRAPIEGKGLGVGGGDGPATDDRDREHVDGGL